MTFRSSLRFRCCKTVQMTQLWFPACLSEPTTESGQFCHIASQHSRVEPVQQQEPDEEWAEAKRSSVSTAFH